MSTKSIRTKTRHASRAFTLIEVTLAVGVAGFCLLTISGLLPVGLSSNQTSLDQTTAGNISSAIVSDLRSAQPVGAVTSPRFGIPIPASSGAAAPITSGTQTIIYLTANGSVTSVNSVGSAAPVFRAAVGFGTPLQRNATPVRVLISWPALAASNSSSWPVNYSGSYEADTTLDRN